MTYSHRFWEPRLPLAIRRQINEEDESQIQPRWNPLAIPPTMKCASGIQMKNSRASAGGRAGTMEIASLAQFNLRHKLPAPQNHPPRWRPRVSGKPLRASKQGATGSSAQPHLNNGDERAGAHPPIGGGNRHFLSFFVDSAEKILLWLGTPREFKPKFSQTQAAIHAWANAHILSHSVACCDLEAAKPVRHRRAPRSIFCPKARRREWAANRRLRRRCPFPPSCLEEPFPVTAAWSACPTAFGVQAHGR